MWPRRVPADDGGVPQYRIHHHHRPTECGAAQAAWRGWTSPLRTEPAVSSCPVGGHEVWWDVEGRGEDDVLGLLPPFVAERSTVHRIGQWAPSGALAPEPLKENPR